MTQAALHPCRWVVESVIIRRFTNPQPIRWRPTSRWPQRHSSPRADRPDRATSRRDRANGPATRHRARAWLTAQCLLAPAWAPALPDEVRQDQCRWMVGYREPCSGAEPAESVEPAEPAEVGRFVLASDQSPASVPLSSVPGPTSAPIPPVKA